jgi:hypothetical protein
MDEALTSTPLRCVDDRDCAVRGRGNCTRTQFVPSFPQGDDRLYYPGNRGITGVANSSVARANWSWTPACEPKGACLLYLLYLLALLALLAGFTCFTCLLYLLYCVRAQRCLLALLALLVQSARLLVQKCKY